jgi:hypothetical protein
MIIKQEITHNKKNISKSYAFTFNPWTDIKLISYWYTPYLVFLDGIAKYIEGEVHWNFENDNEAGYVTFKNGKCEIITGQMNWNTWKPTSSLRKEDLTPDMEKLIVLNKL